MRESIAAGMVIASAKANPDAAPSWEKRATASGMSMKREMTERSMPQRKSSRRKLNREAGSMSLELRMVVVI